MSGAASERLRELRQRVDALDDALLALVAERAAVVDEIAALKEAEGLVMRDPVREQQIVERLLVTRPARLAAPAVSALVEAVLRACFPASRG